MNNLDKQYQALLQDILDNGVEKEDRTGTGTISVFGRQIRHKMSEGYPLLTTKKMAFKTMVTELLWFLRGDTNIKYLVDNGCNIWNGDAYKNFINNPDYKAENVADLMSSQAGQLVKCSTQEEFINKIKTDDKFAEKWGDLGPIYGKQWRSWKTESIIKTNLKDPLTGEYTYVTGTKQIDQIENLINDLKTNPNSRRLMVSAWNVGELSEMTLPPCHYGFQVYTRELSLKERRNWCKVNNVVLEHLEAGLENEEDDMRACGVPTRAISLMFNMRSNDVPLGLPFNISSYGLLLEIFGKMVNMVPDELIVNLGDAHIYKNQVDGVKEQLTREPFNLPNLIISDEVSFGSIDEFLESCDRNSFKLEGYESHPSIKIPLSN